MNDQPWLAAASPPSPHRLTRRLTLGRTPLRSGNKGGRFRGEGWSRWERKTARMCFHGRVHEENRSRFGGEPRHVKTYTDARARLCVPSVTCIRQGWSFIDVGSSHMCTPVISPRLLTTHQPLFEHHRGKYRDRRLSSFRLVLHLFGFLEPYLGSTL